MYLTATVVFSNASDEAVRVIKYRFFWPRGSVTFEPRELVVPPRSDRQRTVRINAGDGELDGLRTDTAQIELVAIVAGR